jgi:hypothetical protein
MSPFPGSVPHVWHRAAPLVDGLLRQPSGIGKGNVYGPIALEYVHCAEDAIHTVHAAHD